VRKLEGTMLVIFIQSSRKLTKIFRSKRQASKKARMKCNAIFSTMKGSIIMANLDC
jgi:hypothetical protein